MTARIIDYGGGWGDSVRAMPSWAEAVDAVHAGKPMRFVGWKTPLPAVGDVIRIPMQGGATTWWEITAIERPPRCDPPDMFFADAKWVEAPR